MNRMYIGSGIYVCDEKEKYKIDKHVKKGIRKEEEHKQTEYVKGYYHVLCVHFSLGPLKWWIRPIKAAKKDIKENSK